MFNNTSHWKIEVAIKIALSDLEQECVLAYTLPATQG